MNLERIAETIIQEAMERGDFDNLPGKGKPIDLTEYFETPEDVRVAQSVLKSAGFVPREVELLREIAKLQQTLSTTAAEEKKREIRKKIQERQIEFNLRMERRKRQK
ncbi:MAG TPA: DUF1992 domain-containing protein [Anaerolineales bacterium]|nr:DUF1992 domain-containing protein [Anaerolineales bacterium]